MIAALTGIPSIIAEKKCIVDVNGVGYLIHINNNTQQKIRSDEVVKFFIHTAISENDMSLYGFLEKAECDFFQQLISVKGVGPKSALDIINEKIERIKSAIVGNDPETLSRVKGIGKKTAARIIIELQNKIDGSLEILEDISHTPAIDDAIEGLISLGYHKHQVIKNLSDMPASINDTEAIIRYFLQNQNA